MNYQDLFVRVRQATDSNDYGKLCHAVVAVFQAAGYDVVQPLELSSRFHSEVVGLIGVPDLAAVARGFCWNWAWHFPPRQMLPLDVDRLAQGTLPWGLVRLRDLPSVPAAPGGAYEISASLREQHIRRGTKRYQAFVAQNAARVRYYLVAAAEREIALWQIRAADAAQQLLRESAGLVEVYAAYYRQGGQIARAFLTVTDQPPDQGGVVALSEALAQRIEQGLARRQAWANELLAYVVGVTATEVVEAALRPHQDLRDLWQVGAKEKCDG